MEAEIDATVKLTDGKTWRIVIKGPITLIDVTPPPPDDEEPPEEPPDDPPSGDLSDLPTDIAQFLSSHPTIKVRSADWAKAKELLK